MRGSIVVLHVTICNMMNWIIGAVIAAVVIVGGGLYLMNSGSLSMTEDAAGGTMLAGEESSDNGMVGGDAVAPKATTGAFTGSFFDLAARGGNYKCDVQSSGTTAHTMGSVYVSGTNLRGDFTSLVSGKTVESHMIKNGDQMYIWGGGLEQGIMMKASSMQSGSASTATQGAGVSGTQSYGWNCAATGVDASKFAAPSDIEFMDVAAMMQGSVPAMMPKVPAY